MHKMFKVYLEDYLSNCIRDGKLIKIKEYNEIESELEDLEKELEEILIKAVGDEKAYDLLSRISRLNYQIDKYETEDVFELGFNTGLQIGIETYNKDKHE